MMDRPRPRCFLQILWLCLLLAGTAWGQTYTLDGAITYDDEPYTRNGFTGATTPEPVRHAQVTLFQMPGDTFVSGPTYTDDSGAYAFAGLGNGDYAVRVYTIAEAAPANVQVQTKTSPSVYAVLSTTRTIAGADATLDVAVTGEPAEAFNILDCAVFLYQFLSDRTATYGGAYPAPPEALTVHWQDGNTVGTYYQALTNSISLLGKATDDDGYDDDIIFHELGHYVLDAFSREDSPGGSHVITGHYDLRLAWSEGWAHFISAAVRQWAHVGDAPGAAGAGRYPDHVYIVDTFGSVQSAFEIEGPHSPTLTTGSDNEVAVAAVLWDLHDVFDAAETFDNLGPDEAGDAQVGDADIWEVIDDRMGPNVYAVPPNWHSGSLERFFDQWLGLHASIAVATRQVLLDRSIRFQDDAREPNDTVATAADLTILTDPIEVPNLTFYDQGAGFPPGDEDWFAFAAIAGYSYQIETLNLADYCDSTLDLFDTNGTTVLATNDDRSPGDFSSILQWSAPATGTYYVRTARYSESPAVGTYGTYDLHITITQTGTNLGPSVTASASTSAGTAPLTVRFTTSISDTDGAVIRYEWDFDGNGVYEYVSYDSGDASYTYAAGGNVTAAVRVTDDDGLMAVATVALSVLPAAGAPIVTVSGSTASGSAPLSATWTANATTSDTIMAYEWDFDGDGIADWLSTSGPSATYTYRLPGAYVASVTVTDSSGRVASGSSTVVTVSGSSPSLDVSADVASGVAPATFTFTATAGLGLYLWDFDGDGQYDRQGTSATETYTYYVSGSYGVGVRARDGSGIENTARISVAVSQGSLTAWLVFPRDGQTISGTRVPVAARVLPAGASHSVRFQYRAPSGSWNDIGEATDGSRSLFTTVWDPSVHAGTSFYLRAVVDGTLSSGDATTLVAVASSGGAVAAVLQGTETVYEAEVPADESALLVLPDGGYVEVPWGTFSGAARLRVRSVTTRAAPSGSAEGLLDAGVVHDVTVVSGGAQQRRLRLSWVFADENEDGIVDGTSVTASTLEMHWYSSSDGTWRREHFSEVDTVGRSVSVWTTHLTPYGLFGEAGTTSGTASYGSGSGGGCWVGRADPELPAGRGEPRRAVLRPDVHVPGRYR